MNKFILPPTFNAADSFIKKAECTTKHHQAHKVLDLRVGLAHRSLGLATERFVDPCKGNKILETR